MQTYLSPSTSIAFSKVLAQQGIDLLSGVFRGDLDSETLEITTLIQDETGIDIRDAVDNKLTETDWARLREFEIEHQSKILAYRKELDVRQTIPYLIYSDTTSDNSSSITTRYGIIFFLVFAFIYIFYAAFIHDYRANPDATRVIDIVLGFLLGALALYFSGILLAVSKSPKNINNISVIESTLKTHRKDSSADIESDIKEERS